MHLTVLVENDAPGNSGLLPTPGLAVWVETDVGAVLFDTDTSPEVLGSNAKELGISLADVRGVVLSHGHYDHTGGLPAVLSVNPEVPIHCAPGLLVPPYKTVPDGPPTFIGSPLLHGEGPVPVGTTTFSGTREILPGCLALNGAIGPSETTFRQLRDGEFVPHRFDDESFLVLDGRDGRTVLVGCSHPGIASIVRFCKTELGLADIRTVIGGLHTPALSEEELHRIASTLKDLGIERTVIGHCSGHAAQRVFRDEFGADATDLITGLQIEL